jgi:hypothetical protein
MKKKLALGIRGCLADDGAETSSSVAPHIAPWKLSISTGEYKCTVGITHLAMNARIQVLLSPFLVRGDEDGSVGR